MLKNGVRHAYSALLLLLFGVLVSGRSLADEKGAALSQEDVMHQAMSLASQATDSTGYSTGIANFDPSSRSWTMSIDSEKSEGNIDHLVFTLNESTGIACLRYRAHAGCAVETNVTQQIAEAKAKAEAIEAAKQFPAPDLQGMVEALLRHEVTPATTGPQTTSSFRFYVSLESPTSPTPIDVSREVIERLRGDGIEVFPASAYQSPTNAATSRNARFYAQLPVRRADGNYNVTYGHYCGLLCFTQSTAIMAYDASGWRVLSTRLELES